MLQLEIEKVRKRREEYAAMKEQMEEEKAVIDRERAIAEGRDGETKEEEVWSCWCLTVRHATSTHAAVALCKLSRWSLWAFTELQQRA